MMDPHPSRLVVSSIYLGLPYYLLGLLLSAIAPVGGCFHKAKAYEFDWGNMAEAQDAAASLAAPLIASLLGAFLVVALVAIIWVLLLRRRKRRAAELPVKTPAVEGTKGSLQDPEKGNTAAAASQVPVLFSQTLADCL